MANGANGAQFEGSMYQLAINSESLSLKIIKKSPAIAGQGVIVRVS
jgi:hypothetical protein